MKNTLCIKIFKDSFIEINSFVINNGFFKQSEDVYLDAVNDNVKNVILFYAKAADNDKMCLELVDPKLQITGNSFQVSYQKLNSFEISSKTFKTDVKRILVNKNIIQRNDYIPNAFLISNDDLMQIPDRDSMDDFLISRLQNKNWDEINSRFSNIDEIRNDQSIWNKPKRLDIIAMSLSKAATLSFIPKEIKADNDKKKKLLQEKAKIRNTIKFIRERCIELVTDDPVYYSNLGYFHYNNCIELRAPGGRRDGNLVDEATHALHYYDLAFELDTNRVKEHYRAGKIYLDVLYSQALYGGGAVKNKFEDASKILNKAIEHFKKAEEIYNTFTPEDRQAKYFKKEYIHSLYALADSYQEKIYKYWDEEKYLIPTKFLEFDLQTNPYFDSEIKKIDSAIAYIEKCIFSDTGKNRIDDLFSAAMVNGEFDAVFKLYKAGDLYLTKYLLYKKNDVEPEETIFDSVYRFLRAAYEVKWTGERNRMSKIFILERLARLFISSDEPSKAVKIFEKYPDFRKRVDSFALNTFALAYKLNGQYDEAIQLSKRAAGDKFNKEEWTTLYIEACCLIEEGKPEKAIEKIEEAQKSASKTGKKNLDSLLISSAHIYYHKGEISKAIKYIETAIELNPRREAALKKYIEWMHSGD